MKETLLEKQFRFSKMVGQLIDFAYANGYQITLGDAYRDERCPYGHKKSLHKLRLAIDINLFDEKGNLLKNYSDHRQLGIFWEKIGGTWGGPFNDCNHYSLSHNGMS